MISSYLKITMGLILLVYILSLYIKRLLEKNDLKTAPFWDNFSDIYYMFRLAKKVEDSFIKRKYYVLASVQLLFILLILICLVMYW